MLVDGDHPASWAEPRRCDLADIGDFRIAHGDIEGTLATIEEQAAPLEHLVALGGDHTITLALLRALARRTGPLGLVHFDGHVDTWPESFGLRFGPWLAVLPRDRGGPDRPAPHDPDRHPLADAPRDPRLDRRQGRHDRLGARRCTKRARRPSPSASARSSATAPAYLSFDIDALDPAFAPGTGTPEIGGLATWQAQAILRRLAGLDFAGMDVVEVSPPYDVAEITALAAATMAWDYLALLAPREQRALRSQFDVLCVNLL